LSDCRHLLFSSAEGLEYPTPAVIQDGEEHIHFLHGLFDSLSVRAEVCPDCKVLLDRKVREDPSSFRRHSQPADWPFPCRQPSDVFPVTQDRPLDSPMRVRRSVVLPAPFGPTIPKKERLHNA